MSEPDDLARARQTMRRFQHEVRTPLGQIIGYAELLEEELEDRGAEDLSPDLQRIRSAAQRLLDLVDGRLRDEDPAGAAPALDAEPESPTDAATPATSEGGGLSEAVELSAAGAVSASSSEGSVDAAASAGGEPELILVVDDDPQNRDLLARRLERQGFEVETARSGVEALRRIEELDPHLVMLDVLMPGMNGLEVLERLRRTRSMAELPVIMATALRETDDAIEGLQRGANDYVTKPFDFPMVMARIRTQLDACRAGRRIKALARQLEFRNSFIREALGREVPAELLVELAETPAAAELAHELRRVTILTVDVQGSRRLARALSPGSYVTLLRQTLGALAATVVERGGSVDAMVGDSVVATFGLPDPGEEDTARGAACALALQQAVPEINARNAAANLPPISLGVGVATGEVAVSGFGSGSEMRFKAIGEPFLQSSRIESRAGSGEVWICDDTRARLGDLAKTYITDTVVAQPVHRLLGVGGAWLMSMRAVPEDID